MEKQKGIIHSFVQFCIHSLIRKANPILTLRHGLLTQGQTVSVFRSNVRVRRKKKNAFIALTVVCYPFKRFGFWCQRKRAAGLFVYDLTFRVFWTICLALQNTSFFVGTVVCDPLERLNHRSNVEQTSKSSTSLIACRIDEGVSLGSRNFPDVAALPMSSALFSRYWKLKRK